MKRVFNLIIVDESGSMSCIERQALAGMNETIETVKRMQELHKNMEQRITLITFDSTHTTFFYDNVPTGRARALTSRDYRPGGATPLYDAIGVGIAKINAQSTAEDHVLVTIITDGEENCSREYSLRMIKTLIEKLKATGWTFTFIGTDNLDVESMASSMGIDNHLEFVETPEGTERMFERERQARVNYNACLADERPIGVGAYFADDEKKPRKRKK